MSGVSIYDSENGKTLSETPLIKLVVSCAQLRHLKLGFSTTSQTIRTIAKHLTHLENFGICDNDKIVDADISYLTQHCTQLTQLIIKRCNNLSKHAVDAIARNVDLKSLQVLKLGDIDDATDAEITTIVRCCTNLLTLHLVYLNVTDKTFEAISIHCKNLKELCIHGTGLRDYGLILVSKGLPNLCVLSLEDLEEDSDVPFEIDTILSRCISPCVVYKGENSL